MVLTTTLLVINVQTKKLHLNFHECSISTIYSWRRDLMSTVHIMCI